jgi:hypothetical protein
MNPEQSLQVIEEALNHATTKGAFNLSDTSKIINSLMTLKTFVDSIKKDTTEAPIKEIKK